MIFGRGKKRTRIFFVSDLHGSDLCFRKLLRTPEIYKANTLIVGGDISGKALVPIVKVAGGGYRARFLGEEVTVSSEEGLKELVRRIRAIGYYPYIAEERDVKELDENPKRLDEVFEEVIRESLTEWVRLAEDSLRRMRDVRLYIIPGNDDPPLVDEVLNSSELIVNPDGKVVELDERHVMLSLGVSNPTPWNCPRDVPEEEIWRRIERLMSSVDRREDLIFNIHVPPYGTHLDLAPKLDENLTPVLTPGGEYELTHVGSEAVRRAIDEYQPKLSLHGHVHESRAIERLGRSLAINPGSEYTQGILKGALIEIVESKVKDYILTSG